MQRPGGRPRRLLGAAGFGIGFVCSGLIGAVVLLVLVFAQTKGARLPRAAPPPDARALLADPSAQSAVEVGGRLAATTAPPNSSIAGIEDLPWGPASVSPARGVTTPFRTEVRAIPRAEERAVASLPRPSLPEGLSSLGGPMGGPAQREERRQVWWTMPAPVWAPFADGASAN